MRRAPCPRLFEVEAARDGRLTGAELASFERHVTGCPACLHEAEALEGLATALRSTPGDGGGTDMLQVRRERTKLLAAFDRTLVAPDHHPNARRRLVYSAVAAALATCVLVLWRLRPDAPPEHRRAVVHADRTAVWSEHREGSRDVVDLQGGALWIHVDHSRGDAQVLVELPDGELEDTGTTFTVSAEDGHTTHVAVEEGHVVFRVRGQAAIAMGPGDTWTLPPRAAVSASASAFAPGTATAAGLDATGRAAPPLPPSAHPVSRSASAPSASAADSSVEFRSAMAALDAGDNRLAATAFTLFLEKHPGDPHAEDAAYLRVIALQRAGDDAAMKRAALEYVRRYPGGFRQAEVEGLAR